MASYLCIWTYRVRPGLQAAFRRVYGPEGDWARLFRRSLGYLRTELYHDADHADTFLIIDYWESRSACAEFHEQNADDYELLNERYAELTVGYERRIGNFEPDEG